MKLDNFDIDNFRFYFSDDDVPVDIVLNKRDTFVIQTDQGFQNYQKGSYRLYFKRRLLFEGFQTFLSESECVKIQNIVSDLVVSYPDFKFKLVNLRLDNGSVYKDYLSNHPEYLAITKNCAGE